jgi:hypothetical protein
VDRHGGIGGGGGSRGDAERFVHPDSHARAGANTHSLEQLVP